jgi:hypothetical protein
VGTKIEQIEGKYAIERGGLFTSVAFNAKQSQNICPYVVIDEKTYLRFPNNIRTEEVITEDAKEEALGTTERAVWMANKALSQFKQQSTSSVDDVALAVTVWLQTGDRLLLLNHVKCYMDEMEKELHALAYCERWQQRLVEKARFLSQNVAANASTKSGEATPADSLY